MKDIIEDIKWEFNFHWNHYVVYPMRRFRAFYQRGKTGYAQSDRYDGHDYLANIIISLVEDLIKNGTGIPFGFDTQDEWNDELRKIAAGFYAWQLWREDNWFVETDNTEERRKACAKAEKEMQKSLEKSMKLLGKHFGHLWD